MTPETVLLSWLASVERSDAAGYAEVDPALVPQDVAGALVHWSRQIFRPSADPHQSGDPVKWSAHLSTPATNDLVRLDYAPLGTPAAVIHSLNFMLVRVRHATPQAGELVALLDALASKLFVPGADGAPISFLPAGTNDRGPILSSSPQADPIILSDWRDRVDAGVRDGVPFFFFYKKLPHIVGYLPGAQTWFAEDFRRRSTLPDATLGR